MIKDGGTNPSTTCKIAAQQLAADSDIVGVVGAMRSSCSKASHQYFRDNGKKIMDTDVCSSNRARFVVRICLLQLSLPLSCNQFVFRLISMHVILSHFNPLLPNVAKGKFRPNLQISFFKILTNKQHHVKVQAESFHFNGNIIGFRPQTQKLESPYKTPSNTLAVKGLINPVIRNLSQKCRCLKENQLYLNVR